MSRRRPPAVRRAAGALGTAAALFGAAGLVLAVAGPAWGDTTPPSDGSGTGSSSPASSPASNLGGYTLASSAAGLSVDYEQPNFPIPAKPTLELDVGYSSASYNAGPVGNANASALWPGPVVAGGGSQLPLLLDPYLEQYFAPLAPAIEPLIPNAGNWPVVATSAYPQGPATATNDNGPMTMRSSADQGASTATSSLALVGGPSSSLPAGLVTVQAVGSTSQDTVDALGDAVSEATSTVHGVDLAGGLVHIGTVSSTATSSSDGNQATLSGSSSVTGATIAGQTVTIDSGGLHVMGNTQNLLGTLVPSVNQALAAAGITLTLTSPTDTVQGPSGQRLLNGLQVHWDLSTYDQDFAQLLAMLPSQLTSQLPLPPPYKQSITFDIGWAQVNANASPPFDASLGTTDLGSGGDNGAGATLGSTDTGSLGSGPALGPTAAGTGAGTTQALPARLAAPAALFRGIGAGLIALGAVLAAILVGLLLFADRVVGRLAAAAPCTGEDVGDFV